MVIACDNDNAADNDDDNMRRMWLVMWFMVHVVDVVHYDEEEEDMVGLVR